ncbi:MAG: hypothetical protein HYX93_07085 [Chloroflexi bacterium]|nr:hypothetical protein [Chloroflexota bacterium]
MKRVIIALGLALTLLALFAATALAFPPPADPPCDVPGFTDNAPERVQADLCGAAGG